MSEILRKLRSNFQPWIIAAVAGSLFGLFVISLNYLLGGKTGFQFFEIDYSMHLFFTKPFTKLNDMDSTVVLGSSFVYWGLGVLFLLKSYPESNLKKTKRVLLSDTIQIVAAGFIIYYFLLLFCCWLLALYEGYVPMIFDDFYQNHGPWRFIPHLRLLIFWSFLQIVMSFALSGLSFLIKFNRQSLILIVFSCFIFVFHVYSHLWLID